MFARLLLAAAVLSLPAFAPAPFPRASRGGAPDVTLDAFQGTWKAESFETVAKAGRTKHTGWDNTSVRIEKDRWTYYEGANVNAAYRIRIEKKNPSAIDFYKIADDGHYMAGIIRRRAGRVEILFNNVDRGGRATSFDRPPEGWWVLTLRPDR